MNIGKMYKIKRYFWVLVPNKETRVDIFANAVSAEDAAWLSKRYNSNITHASPEEFIILLELDGKFKKVLTANGDIGWTWFAETHNNCFEEVTKP